MRTVKVGALICSNDRANTIEKIQYSTDIAPAVNKKLFIQNVNSQRPVFKKKFLLNVSDSYSTCKIITYIYSFCRGIDFGDAIKKNSTD